VPDALFFAGFSKDDANPDIGDSAITETGGLGGFAIASAPAIVGFVGGKAADAVNYTLQMYEITAAESEAYQIPYLNFRGTPTGIDVIKVVENGITPFIDTGVAHKKLESGRWARAFYRRRLSHLLRPTKGCRKLFNQYREMSI
jgi:hypothetical protein